MTTEEDWGVMGRLASATVRVLTASGEVVGAGFAVGRGLVASCAHVVAEAVGSDPVDEQPPTAMVLLDFPLLPGAGRRAARVRRWAAIGSDGGGDIAVLELIDSVADSVAVPPFWRAPDPWGREFRMFGFPIEIPEGVWVSGEFRAPQGSGWLQLQAATGGQPITAGFSGAAVWDSSSDAVVGMAVAADRRRYTRTAFMIPIDEVLETDPTLRPNPYRGLERFEERDAHLFYGRDADIDRVVSALEHRSFVVVAGRSGTGKSSLVSAGVIPRLRTLGMSIAEHRLVGDASLELETVDAYFTAETVPSEGLLLFLDQFEDLAIAAPERGRALLRRLIDLADTDGAPRVRVVLTLRWEALNELLDDELATVIDGGTVALAPMGREQLRRVIRGPATHAPGVGLDADLVERLIDDTVHEPGGLPLLESMLTELWEQRGGGQLTVADYERLGRVGGSITRRAERALAQFANPGDAAAVRRLLLLLTAPAPETDGFIRSVVTMSDFPELRFVAGRLARDRLVVVGRRPDEAEIVELAHQALIDNWPLLRTWLEADRDFRSWQHQLENEHTTWEAAQHDNGALLRGSALSTAEEWLAARESDIPDKHRRYIGLSLRLRRREVRRWRAAAAVVAVLAVAAAGTAVVAYHTSQQRAAQLRLSNGIGLATQSIRVAERNPLTALQFAQAAARNAPGRPEVEEALLHQEIEFAGVSSYTPGHWADPSNLSTSADGSVFLVVGKDGSATIWTGVLPGRPTPWQLRPPGSKPVAATGLSRDGSRVALMTDKGGVLMWDIRHRQGPITVRPEGGAERLGSTIGLFSADGTRLVLSDNPDRNQDRYTTRPNRIDVYDTSNAHPVRISRFSTGEPMDLIPERVDPDGKTVWFAEQTFATNTIVNDVRDADSGQLVRRLPSGSITEEGAITNCVKASADSSTDDYVISDGATGIERRRFEIPSGMCENAAIDRSGRFTIMTDYVAGDTFGLNQVVDLETGDLFRFQMVPGLSPDGYVVQPTAAGPQVTVFTPTGLLRYKPSVPIDDPNRFRDPHDTVWGTDQRTIADYYAGSPTGPTRLELVQLLPRQRRLSGTAIGPGPGELDVGQGDIALAITADNRNLLVIGQTNQLRVYSTDDLRLVRTMTLPVPSELGSPGPWNGKDILPLGSDEVAVYYAGVLTRWRVSDGRQLGDPVPVYQNIEDLRLLATTGKATARQDQAGQILIVTPYYLKVWDIRRARTLRSWHPDGLDSFPSYYVQPNMPEVYVQDKIWNMDTGLLLTPSHPMPNPDDVRGHTKDGLIIVVNGSVVEIWDDQRGRIGDFHPPGSQILVKSIADSALFLLSSDGVSLIDLQRKNLLQHLCAINDRPYTTAELSQLPSGTDTTPPCH